MSTRKNFPDRVKARQEEAATRQAERDTRGDQGQLNRLKQQGLGECREAKRLQKKLEQD
jgi:hypothetical protein